MNEQVIRKIKGVIMMITFLVAAIALYNQKGIGTIYYIHVIGFDENIAVGGFIVAGFSCGYIGLKGLAWNILCYIPFLIYTGASWLAIVERMSNPTITSPVPVATGCFYSLLLAFLVLDWYQDWKGLLWNKTQ